MKQGGIISPRLFIVYVNDLIQLLRKKGVGCHILNLFLGCIMFADDLALIAPTRGSMQEMLDICESYCRDYCLTFNTAKTKSLIFGKCSVNFVPCPLFLNANPIQYVDEWKYLGCLISAGKNFSFSAKADLRSFYCSANSILTVLKKTNEQTSMMLLYSNCVPILSYACEVKSFSSSEMTQCAVALNNCIRKIFTYKRWESIRVLRELFGYPDLYTIFAKRKRYFLTNICSIGNSTLSNLYHTLYSLSS